MSFSDLSNEMEGSFRYVPNDRIGMQNSFDQEIANNHKLFNLWHSISGRTFIAEPASALVWIRQASVIKNHHAIYSHESKREILSTYVSPIIAYHSKKLWPRQHRLETRESLLSPFEHSLYHNKRTILVSWCSDINNYFHLIFDLCSKLEVLELNIDNLPVGAPIQIGGDILMKNYMILHVLYPKLSALLDRTWGPSVFFKELIIPVTPQPIYLSSLYVKKLSSRIARLATSSSARFNVCTLMDTQRRVVYFMRGKTGKNGREIKNEDELVSILRSRYDAVCLDGGELMYEQQWSISRSATHIIAPHGASLTNILACKPGTSVVEILPETYAPSTFKYISDALGLNHKRYIYNDKKGEINITKLLLYLSNICGC
jgi:hypothetical protein